MPNGMAGELVMVVRSVDERSTREAANNDLYDVAVTIAPETLCQDY